MIGMSESNRIILLKANGVQPSYKVLPNLKFLFSSLGPWYTATEAQGASLRCAGTTEGTKWELVHQMDR